MIPDSFIFDNLSYNEVRSFEITVFGPTEDMSFKVENIVGNGDNITSRISEEYTINDINRKVFKIKNIINNNSFEDWNDYIQIYTTDADKPVLNIPITVKQKPFIQISPNIITLDCINNTSDKISEKVMLKINSDIKYEDLKIHKNDNINVEIKYINDESEYGIELIVKPIGKMSKTFMETIKIEGENSQVIEIPVWILVDE